MSEEVKNVPEQMARKDITKEKYTDICADIIMRMPRHEICAKWNCDRKTVERAWKWFKEQRKEGGFASEDHLIVLKEILEKLSGKIQGRIETLQKGLGFADAETKYIKQLVEIEKYLAELRGLHRLKVEVEHTGEVKVEHEFKPEQERAILSAATAFLAGGVTDTGGTGEAEAEGAGSEETPGDD